MLMQLRGVSLGFGGDPLLDRIELQLNDGERLCLVGRNGTGKTTLMRLLCGELVADDGEVSRRQGLRVARLAQEVPRETGGSVYDVVAGGLGRTGELLADFHRLADQIATEPAEAALSRLENLQHDLEAAGGWEVRQRVETVLSRLGLNADVDFSHLSGGLKRRVMLARALVQQPDVLCLDEPTNHLDIASIEWLEGFLHGYPGTLLFVTHDRMFLRHLATRIIELDRGRLASWPGDYDTYLRRKQAALDAEAGEQALFDRKLAQEETWIRQGIQARRTRNEGRVRALQDMREKRRARRALMGKAKLELQDVQRSGKLVVEVDDIVYAIDGRRIVDGFSATILRGDKVGVMGPNGAGKTTLLRLLLGELAPDAGRVRLGTKLEIAYFDQHRMQLEETVTVFDTVGEGRDRITVNGRSRHVMGYLQDFLFSPDRARTPVSALSGGERNRLLLARMFTRTANMLVLDEPTNDLDVETLELLETLLVEFTGTLLLVSHDRAFLNNVVTSTLVFEGPGKVNEYVGGYDDWLRQCKDNTATGTTPKMSANGTSNKPRTARARKLGYKEQRELEALPARIESLENEQRELHASMADPEFYRREAGNIAAAKERLEALEQELARAYQRWEELESI